jgi:hypothetical protein
MGAATKVSPSSPLKTLGLSVSLNSPLLGTHARVAVWDSDVFSVT